MKAFRKPLILFAVMLAASCDSNESNSGQIVVARAGNAVLTKTELEKLLPLSASLEDKFSAINKWATAEVLYQAGKISGFEKDLGVQSSLKKYRHALVGKIYLESITHSAITVTKEDIFDYYQLNKSSFYRSFDEARILHGRFGTEHEATRSKRLLMNQQPFPDSISLSGNPVELITITKGEAIDPIDKIVFSPSSKTGFFGPIKSSRGFHVIQILNKYKAGTIKPIDQVFDEIRRRLTQQQKTVAELSVLDSLKRQVGVESYLEQQP